MSANSYNRYPDLSAYDEIARLTQNMHPPGVVESDFYASMIMHKLVLCPGPVSGKKKVSKLLLADHAMKETKCLTRLAAALKTRRAAVAAAAPGEDPPNLGEEHDWSKWMLEDLEERGGSECTMKMIVDKFADDHPCYAGRAWEIMLTAYYKYKELDEDKIDAAKTAHWRRWTQATIETPAYQQLSPEMQSVLSRLL
jgi:hypothetical protein